MSHIPACRLRPTLESVTALDGEPPTASHLEALQALWDACDRPADPSTLNDPATLWDGTALWVRTDRRDRHGKYLYRKQVQ